MTHKEIKQIVRLTIDELKRQGFFRNNNELAYAEISSVLTAYYKDGEKDEAVAEALRQLSADPYFRIIPLYYDYGYTIDKLAELFNVEVSTITRNKKRLCLQIYSAIT